MSLIEKAVADLFKGSGLDQANRDTLDRGTDLREAEALLVPRLGAEHKSSLDFNKLERLGIITPDKPRSRIAVELRHIKRRLLNETTEQSGVWVDGVYRNLIMVTSSIIGEGKTFLAINLAINIAMEVGRRVVLVDTDVANGDVAKVLGIDSKPGLTDLLTYPNLTLLDVLISTNIDGLQILPVGTKITNVADLFSSAKMERFLKAMAQQFADRIIIFDGPPLLAASESSVLARFMGQVVVVVQEERTTREDLLTGLKQIEFAKNIGLVLNKSFDRSETMYFEDYQCV
ncbi:MAG: AAA family ATPase [Nitrososphaera sp.]|nr:AAA family ATPase [Nitrososphaera sp.]